MFHIRLFVLDTFGVVRLIIRFDFSQVLPLFHLPKKNTHCFFNKETVRVFAIYEVPNNFLGFSQFTPYNLQLTIYNVFYYCWVE
jgi:hypothetical protein